jgi:integrase
MGTRRGNGEGSITRRSDGRWEARISLEGGTRRSFFAKTRQEAARKLAEALRDRDKGLPVVSERRTIAQYASEWQSSVAPTLGPTSIIRYDECLRLHILPYIGTTLLARLTPQQVQATYAKCLDMGLSSTHVHMIHGVLHKMLNDAMRSGLVQRNVSEMVDVPRVRSHEMQVYTPEQARAFLEAARGHRLEALWILALSTGMRQGELFALKWANVDVETAILQVRGTLKRIDSKLVILQTKTKRSRRRIALTPLACEALRKHHATQLEERLALGPAWQDKDLVFPNTVGNLYSLGDFHYRIFWPLIEKAGLPRIRFHDLRHTAATLLLLQGVHVKVVSEVLGHSSITITLDRYSHVLPDMQRDAALAMQRVLG